MEYRLGPPWGGRSVALRLESFLLHALLEFRLSISKTNRSKLAATLRHADSESMIAGGALETSGHRSLVDIYYRYIPLLEVAMGKNGIAKLFRNGRSQAVRLPQEFRFEGDRVRIRRIDHGVILEPLVPDAAKWFDEMDRFNQEQFMGKRRNQPITPRREIFK